VGRIALSVKAFGFASSPVGRAIGRPGNKYEKQEIVGLVIEVK